jgi:hypothetical protein
MGLVDVLRKLGILRFGAEKAVYRNAKERPLSLQQEGVFDSQRDAADLRKSRESRRGEAAKGEDR